VVLGRRACGAAAGLCGRRREEERGTGLPELVWNGVRKGSSFYDLFALRKLQDILKGKN
jgi:hypothetical protein